MNIALLIDCENARADSIDGILGELAERGTTSIRRAYANWKNQPAWEEKLHPFAIQPIQQFAYTKGKNAVDICIAIDAMELLSENIDTFALVTSDSDFTPLVLKLLSKGRTVIGFGESKTPDPFKKACRCSSIPMSSRRPRSRIPSLRAPRGDPATSCAATPSS